MSELCPLWLATTIHGVTKTRRSLDLAKTTQQIGNLDTDRLSNPRFRGSRENSLSQSHSFECSGNSRAQFASAP